MFTAKYTRQELFIVVVSWCATAVILLFMPGVARISGVVMLLAPIVCIAMAASIVACLMWSAEPDGFLQ